MSHCWVTHFVAPFFACVAVVSMDAFFLSVSFSFRTIPIAKRRYYGRVQQGVHEFLAMGKDVVNGDMTAESIQHFFDPLGTVVVTSKRSDIRGQCTKKDQNCRGKEIRDSRYKDMVSLYDCPDSWDTSLF